MNQYILLSLTLVACFMQGCKNDKVISIIDYEATTRYMVENSSDMAINFLIVYGKINGNDLSRTISIMPGEKKEVHRTSEMCGEHYMIPEYAGDVLPIILENISIGIYADNNKVNGEILSKDNWVFIAEEYYKADYLLVITNELIESAGYLFP